MRLIYLYFFGIIILSCGNNSVSNTKTVADSSHLSLTILTPPVVDTFPNSSKRFALDPSDKRIKAIDDIYFGIPISDHGKYFNKQISLGDCYFKVKYLGYNEYSLGDNTVSGLYSLRLNSEDVCNGLDYLVTLFSTKYGQPKRIITNETVGLPDLKDIREIEKWDNSYVAMMESSLPGNQQSSRLYLTDEKTTFPNNEVVHQTLYKWETDSILIELNEGFQYLPIGSKKGIIVKGPKSGSTYDCETVEKFILIKKPFIDFKHPYTDFKLKIYLDQQKINNDKERLKKDGEKL
jgi:hypothetical protein